MTRSTCELRSCFSGRPWCFPLGSSRCICSSAKGGSGTEVLVHAFIAELRERHDVDVVTRTTPQFSWAGKTQSVLRTPYFSLMAQHHYKTPAIGTASISETNATEIGTASIRVLSPAPRQPGLCLNRQTSQELPFRPILYRGSKVPRMPSSSRQLSSIAPSHEANQQDRDCGELWQSHPSRRDVHHPVKVLAGEEILESDPELRGRAASIQFLIRRARAVDALIAHLKALCLIGNAIGMLQTTSPRLFTSNTQLPLSR